MKITNNVKKIIDDIEPLLLLARMADILWLHKKSMPMLESEDAMTLLILSREKSQI